jgi:membrane protease YdiL (CAAX protease family)
MFALVRNRWLWMYLLIYVALLAALVRVEKMELAEPLFVLIVLGLVFSLVATLVTYGIKPLPYVVRAPGAELGVLSGWLIVIAVYFVFGKSAIDAFTTAEPLHTILGMAIKLLLFVVAPGFILARRYGYAWYELAPLSLRLRDIHPAFWFSALMLGFQAVFGSGIREMREAHIGWGTALAVAPLAFLWLAIEAGLVEEFFFRALLQTRVARVLRSEVAAIVVTSVVFGLVHAPGLYLRTQSTGEGLSHPSLLFAVGYSFVIVSVAGFFLGTLWARTRNLALVVLVHAAADLLPNIADFMRQWHIAG